MTEKYTPTYNETQLLQQVDAEIHRLYPSMEAFQRMLSQHLFIRLHRVFTATDFDPSETQTIVELGIGNAPYLPAITALCHPETYVGIDKEDYARDIRGSYPALFQQEGFRFIHGDASYPDTIASLPHPRNIDMIIALNPSELIPPPDIPPGEMYETKAIAMLARWRERLHPEGRMVITTYLPEEAETILKSPRLAPYVQTFTAAETSPYYPNSYMLTLGSQERREEVIVV